MKLNTNIIKTETRNIIAWFGTARLTRDRKGVVELEGGSPSDRQAALEWISLFFHEAAPRIVANN